MSGSHVKIAGALLIGAVFIAAALLMRSNMDKRDGNTPTTDVAVVTQAPKREPIKTIDKNNDGVPDWQESLLVTKALQIASTTNDYTKPETLTEQFALDFFQEVVRSKNYGAFGDTKEELVFNASDALAKTAVDTLITRKDIRTSLDNSPEAQSWYGEQVATIIEKYSQDDAENEARILERALRAQDAQELQKLDVLVDIYTKYLQETQALTVPSALKIEHLNLLNSYKAILEDIKAMRSAFTDPMYTLLRLKRYQDDASGLYTSIIDLYTQALAGGATWEKQSPVFSFITFNEDVPN